MNKHSETVRGLIADIAAEVAERDSVTVGVVQYHIATNFVIDAARREADSLITGNSTAAVVEEPSLPDQKPEVVAPAAETENAEAEHENG